MKTVIWSMMGLAAAFFGLIGFMTFDEWRTVQIKQDMGNYPWGLMNQNPWYYANPELYSTVMLIQWIGLTVLLGFVIGFMMKKDRKRAAYSLLACFVFFTAMMINGKI